MMEQLNPRARSDEYGSRINRVHSPVLGHGIPPLTVVLASFLPALIMTSALPFIPPFGFMMLVAWRIVRPGLFPVWIGLPLGAFDDLFSGQPFGSAILLWSLAMIAIELVEARFPWRNFVQDWLAISALVALYILAAAFVSGAKLTVPGVAALLPQILFSALLFPLVARLVARWDRLRLKRFVKVS